MNNDNLVRMANRIGAFFASMPDRDEARDGIAGHLRRYWEPRMRRQLMAHVDAGGAGMDALVLEAVATHAEALRPAPAPGPAA